MRRKDRNVVEINQIRGILDSCKTCHLAMVDDGLPYVIPLSYGYDITNDNITLYFHSAKKGRKLNILRESSDVCFEISCEGEPIFSAATPCNSGYYYSSVIGVGKVEFIIDIAEKCDALSVLTHHQTGVHCDFIGEQADTVCVYKVVSSDFTGKLKPRPIDK